MQKINLDTVYKFNIVLKIEMYIFSQISFLKRDEILSAKI